MKARTPPTPEIKDSTESPEAIGRTVLSKSFGVVYFTLPDKIKFANNPSASCGK